MLKKIKELPAKFEKKELEESLTPKAHPDSPDQSDPLFKKFHARNTMASIIVVEQGVIQDVFPFLRLYKVALNAGPITVCTFGGESTGGLFGVQDQSTLVVGTTVWVVRYPGTGYGTIISTQPEFVTVFGSRKVEELVDGSNIGYISEPIYRTLLAYKPPRGGMPMWEGAHLDSIPGEWVKMAHTGIGIFVDPFLAGIKANDYCGVWVNYLDSLLRIAGLNYQRWTGGTEEYDYVDGSAVLTYKGYGYTIANQGGSYLFDYIKCQHIPPEVNHNSRVRASSLEPETALRANVYGSARLPFHYKQSWGGVLGQGGLDITVSKGRVPFNLKDVRGGTQVANTASGFHIVQARCGILLAKYPLIPVPIKLFDFDEALEEKTENMRKRVRAAISMMQRGEDYPYGGAFTPKTLWNVRLNNIRDIRNFLCNWEALAGIYAYIDNFIIQTEKDVLLGNIVDMDRPTEKPGFIYIDIEGNILLENGYGTRVELVGTDIRLTAANNIYIDCGNKLSLFGRDVFVRGHYTAGLASNKRGLSMGDKFDLKVDKFQAEVADIKKCEPTGPEYTDGAEIPPSPWIYHVEKSSYTEARPSDSGGRAYVGPPKYVNKKRGFSYMPEQIAQNIRDDSRIFGCKLPPPPQDEDAWRQGIKPAVYILRDNWH